MSAHAPLDPVTRGLIEDMAAGRAPAESAWMRTECEAKFKLVSATMLAEALRQAGFREHAPRHELDLVYEPAGAAAPGVLTKVRFAPEFNRLSLVIKQRAPDEVARVGASISRVFWRDYAANGVLLHELARAGLRSADAVVKKRVVFTKERASVCIDQLAGVGLYAEVGVSAPVPVGGGDGIADAARALATALAAHLGAPASASYLEIVRSSR